MVSFSITKFQRGTLKLSTTSKNASEISKEKDNRMLFVLKIIELAEYSSELALKCGNALNAK